MPILFYSLLPEIRREENSPLAMETLREKDHPTCWNFLPQRKEGARGYELQWTQISFPPYGEMQLQRRSETEAKHGLGSTQKRVKLEGQMSSYGL